MFDINDTIKPVPPMEANYTAGIGYIAVPPDVDRDEYVNDCLRTCTVSIYGGIHYSYFHNVSVDTEVIQRVKFPLNDVTYGSPVVWVKIDGFNKPVIVGILRYENDFYEVDEYSRNETIEVDGKRIDISKRAQDAIVDVVIKGNTDNPGELNINVQDNEDKGTINTYVQGTINFHATKEINLVSDEVLNFVVLDDEKRERVKINYSIYEGFSYKDEFDNEITCKDGVVKIVSKKIDHNYGKEPMVLGDTLQQKLGQLIDEIMKIQVFTALGPSSVPINNPQFVAIKATLEQIKSKISNLD